MRANAFYQNGSTVPANRVFTQVSALNEAAVEAKLVFN
jgi:hypothetical protein